MSLSESVCQTKMMSSHAVVVSSCSKIHVYSTMPCLFYKDSLFHSIGFMHTVMCSMAWHESICSRDQPCRSKYTRHLPASRLVSGQPFARSAALVSAPLLSSFQELSNFLSMPLCMLHLPSPRCITHHRTFLHEDTARTRAHQTNFLDLPRTAIG